MRPAHAPKERREPNQTTTSPPAAFGTHYLLNVLQMSETALKTLSEKLTFTLTYFMLGS